jgi:hypothetical protein
MGNDYFKCVVYDMTVLFFQILVLQDRKMFDSI